MFEFANEKEDKDKFGIYEIKNKNTGCVYIGQTRQAFIKRFRYHRWQLRTNSHENPYLQSSFNKHGEDAFVFSARIIVTNVDELDRLEIQEIEKVRNEGSCYNMLSGGVGRPGVALPEFRKKELAELNRILNTGKKASAETRFKMSQSQKGRKMTEEALSKRKKTKQENILNGVKYKVQKITPEQAFQIKKDLMNNVSYEYLAVKYGITYSNINAIRSNRSWKYVQVDGWDEYCKTHVNNVRARQSRSAN